MSEYEFWSRTVLLVAFTLKALHEIFVDDDPSAGWASFYTLFATVQLFALADAEVA